MSGSLRVGIPGRIALVVTGLVLTLALAGVRWNYSPSVPVGLYWTHHPATVQLGDYVCIPVHGRESPAALRSDLIRVEFRSLLKKVEGLPGNRISYDGAVFVGDRKLSNSTWLPRDGANRPMPRPSLPKVLGDDEFWVSSSHPKGIDSRYFGPVTKRAIECVAEPLWIF